MLIRQLVLRFCLVTTIAGSVATPSVVTAESEAGPGALGAGWTALDAGRTDEAVAAADNALAAFPHDHGAIVLKVRALASAGRVAAAIDAYDAWTGTHGTGDVYLLGLVAESVLRTLGAAAPLLEQRVAALDALSEAGDTAARHDLAALGPRAGIRGQASLAAGGDRQAGAELLEMARTASGSARVAAIEALAEARPDGAAAAVKAALSDPDPMVRSAAVRTAGALAGPSGADALVPLLRDGSADVRQEAALALAAAGRTEGDTLVDGMLGTGIPDLVLAVAEALPTQASRWESAVRPVLENENPVDRLRAARLLETVDPEGARRVVEAGLRDQNPAVREEAARSLSVFATGTAQPDWKRLLSDASPWVRLEAAARIFREATGQRVKETSR